LMPSGMNERMRECENVRMQECKNARIDNYKFTSLS